MNELISYAQNREDVYLNWLLAGKENGFYVDVGASDPIHDSVTKFFYDRGWSGINIEPIDTHFKNLIKERPRDINLQIGIAQTTGKLQFRQYTDGDGLSTFSEVTKQEHLDSLKYLDYEVNVRRLEDVLNEYQVKNIDFMKIDVEGYEYEVISSNDWTKYKPTILIVEANHIHKDWRSILMHHGYQQIFYDGLNEYYSSNPKTQNKNIETYPEFMIGPLIINQRIVEYIKLRESVVIERITTKLSHTTRLINAQLNEQTKKYELSQKLTHQLKEMNTIQAIQIKDANDEISTILNHARYLEQEMLQYVRVRSIAKQLIKAIDKSILLHIQKLSIHQESAIDIYYQIDLESIDRKDRHNSLNIIRKNDIMNFYNPDYKPPLIYKMVYESYFRISRNIYKNLVSIRQIWIKK